MKHFSEFIAHGASADQIEFVSTVIEHVTRNGLIYPRLLYDSPFSDLAPDGPDGLFPEGTVDRFMSSVRQLNRNAVPYTSSADVG